jgi:hypothetical protein
VTVSGVKVEITQAPDYLFANARYATPIRFKIKGESLSFTEIEAMLQSVTVSFYAADGDGSKEEHQRFMTGNLAPTSSDPTGRIGRIIDPTLLTKADSPWQLLGHKESDGQKNLYEVYVHSKEFRSKACDLTHHFTKHARLAVSIGLATGGSAKKIELLSGRGGKVKRFGDRGIAAWDMRPSKLGHRAFKTRVGALMSEPQPATELAGWQGDKGYVIADDDIYLGATTEWIIDLCVGETGRRRSKFRRILKAYQLPKDRFDRTTHSARIVYWNSMADSGYMPRVRRAVYSPHDAYEWVISFCESEPLNAFDSCTIDFSEGNDNLKIATQSQLIAADTAGFLAVDSCEATAGFAPKYGIGEIEVEVYR